jgi:hypothetical protein
MMTIGASYVKILDRIIPVATSSSAEVTPLASGAAASTDRAVLERSASEGETSSGKSIILSGIFTAAHTAG